MRYLYLAFGNNPYSANGDTIVDNYPDSTLAKQWNSTTGEAPSVGDVISFNSYAGNMGHTGIVSASSVDGNGNGSITVFSENTTNSTQPYLTLSVSSWTVGTASGFGTVRGWLHAPAPGNIAVSSSVSVSPNPLTVGQVISGGFTVSNTGGQSFTLDALDLYATGPNNASFEIYSDNNSAPLAPGTRQLSLPSGTLFGANQPNLINGTYTLTARYEDASGWHTLTGINGASPTEQINADVIPANVTTLKDPSGAVHLFQIDTNNIVSWNISNTSAPGGWNGWREILPGVTAFIGKISAMVDANNDPAFAVRDTSGNVYYSTMVSGVWQAYHSDSDPSGVTLGDPLATLTPDYGHIPDLFAVGSDGNFYQDYLLNGSWSGWGLFGGQNAPAAFTGDVGYVKNSNGFPELFVRDTNGNIWVNEENTNSTWTGWQEMATGSSAIVGNPIATYDQLNNVTQVYARGADGNIWYAYTHSGGQAGFTTFASFYAGPTFVGDPAYALDASNDIEILARGTNNNFYLNAESGGSWTNWQQFGWGNTYASNPSLVAGPGGTLESFAYDASGNLYHNWQTSNNWSSWSNWLLLTRSNIPSASGAISSIKDYSGAMNLFYVDQNGNVETDVTNASDPGGWSG